MPQANLLFPLGRHEDAAANHDPRSLAYPAQADAPIVNKNHRLYGYALDQLRLGSCVPNAGLGCLNHSPFYVPGSGVYHEVDVTGGDTPENGWYHRVTSIDPYPGTWPPEDTGSDGLSMGKALLVGGKISSYQHAFGLDHTLAAAMDRPLIVGMDWDESMFYPNSSGLVTPDGNYAGGHEVCLDGVSVTYRLARFLNSWGRGWGINGRFYMTWDAFGAKLSAGGDSTQFTK